MQYRQTGPNIGRRLRAFSIFGIWSNFTIRDNTCLHDVGPRPEELPVELSDGIRMLHRGLGGPGPGLDVASLLQLEHEASISDDRAGGESLENSLNSLFIISLSA